MVLLLEHLYREGVQCGLWPRACGVDVETVPREVTQDAFGKDRPGGVAGADEQDVELVVGHGSVSI